MGGSLLIHPASTQTAGIGKSCPIHEPDGEKRVTWLKLPNFVGHCLLQSKCLIWEHGFISGTATQAPPWVAIIIFI